MRHLSLRTRNSAAYKGIYALLISEAWAGIPDACRSASKPVRGKIDIQHIFPKGWCKKHEIEHKRNDDMEFDEAA